MSLLEKKTFTEDGFYILENPNPIQISSALATFGRVEVRGIVTVTTPILLPSNSYLRGGTYVEQNTSLSTLFTVPPNAWSATGYNGASNITLDGIKVRLHPSTTQTRQITPVFICHTDGVTIKNSEIESSGSWHGIEINSSRRVVIERNKVYVKSGNTPQSNNELIQIDIAQTGSDTGTFTFNADNTPSSHVVIKYNTCTNGWAGIGSHRSNSAEYITVIGNTVYMTPSDSYAGIRAYGWQYGTISGNYIDGGGPTASTITAYGIVLEHSSANAIQVIGNRIENIRGANKRAIHIPPPQSSLTNTDAIYTANYVSNIGRHGISADRVRVVNSGNVVLNQGQDVTGTNMHAMTLWNGVGLLKGVAGSVSNITDKSSVWAEAGEAHARILTYNVHSHNGSTNTVTLYVGGSNVSSRVAPISIWGSNNFMRSLSVVSTTANGTQTSFSWSLSLGSNNSKVIVVPANSASAGFSSYSFTAPNLTITFSTPPANGTLLRYYVLGVSA